MKESKQEDKLKSNEEMTFAGCSLAFSSVAQNKIKSNCYAVQSSKSRLTLCAVKLRILCHLCGSN